jgi:phosphate transport system protein
VLAPRKRVNQMEVEIDRDLSTIIARRQPTARDLRLLIAVSKTIANLERVGDEAARIARTCSAWSTPACPAACACRCPTCLRGRLAVTAQLRKALDAFARLDTPGALQVLKQDDQIDREFDGLMRKLITYMMEDPRTISPASTWCSWPRRSSASATTPRTWPRQIIYIVKGTDVRHNPDGPPVGRVGGPMVNAMGRMGMARSWSSRTSRRSPS